MHVVIFVIQKILNVWSYIVVPLVFSVPPDVLPSPKLAVDKEFEAIDLTHLKPIATLGVGGFGRVELVSSKFHSNLARMWHISLQISYSNLI